MELIGTWNFYYIFLTALIDVSKSFAIFLTIAKSKWYLNCLVYVFFFFVFCCCFLVLKTHKYQTQFYIGSSCRKSRNYNISDKKVWLIKSGNIIKSYTNVFEVKWDFVPEYLRFSFLIVAYLREILAISEAGYNLFSAAVFILQKQLFADVLQNKRSQKFRNI